MADQAVSPQTLLAIIRAARPKYRNAADRLAYAVHAYMLARGYKLVEVGGGATDTVPDKSAAEVSTEGWQESGEEYLFQYVDDTGNGSPITVKALTMNDKLLTYFLRNPDAELQHVELYIPHFTTEDQDLARGYQNLDELTQLLDSCLKSKPSSASTADKAMSAQREAGPTPVEDEPLREGPPQPGRMPNLAPRIGDVDLFPPDLGPPGRMPGRDPLAVGGPSHLGPGGMLVGPNDPMFSGRRGMGPDAPWGGPQGIPGVNWDPIRPPGLPGFLPPGGRPGGTWPGQVHPDIMPPGPGGYNDDMYG